MKTIFDVGCGSKPRGHVNLDLYQGYSPHHARYIDGREYPKFIKGSATELPIKSNSFNVVYCSHVLEHLPDPLRGVLELKRVSRNLVVIKVPNNPLHEHEQHQYTWSLTSLRNFLKPHFKKVEVYPNTNMVNSRLFKLLEGDRLGKFKLFTRRLGRLIRSLTGLELVALCHVNNTEGVHAYKHTELKNDKDKDAESSHSATSIAAELEI